MFYFYLQYSSTLCLWIFSFFLSFYYFFEWGEYGSGICVHVFMWAHILRPEEEAGCPVPSFSAVFLWGRVFHRIWSLLPPPSPPSPLLLLFSLLLSLPLSLSSSFLLPPLPGECNHGVYVCETILPIELMLYNLPSVWGKTKLERVIVCSVLSSRTKNRSQIFRKKIQYLFAVSYGDHFSFKWLKITH